MASRLLLFGVALAAATPLLSRLILASPHGSAVLPADRAPAQRHAVNTKDVKEIIAAAFQGVSEHRLSLLAAGVAFYSLFALFPALGAATSIFGLLADPATIKSELAAMKDVLPGEAWQLIDQELGALTSRGGAGLSLAGIAGLLIALYSARTAASSMMDALNEVYSLDETRGFLTTNALAILFTLVAIVILLAAIGAMIVLPILFNFVGLGSAAADIANYVRWPALAVVMALALALTYRFGPDRRNAHWKWLTWGSATATVIWLIASLGFAWYVSAFNSYDKVYGSIGAVVILLFWFWLTAFIGLLGAEIDNAVERHFGVPPR